MKVKRIIAVVKGFLFCVTHKMNSGCLLEVYPRVHMNCKRKNALVIGKNVALYHDVGIFIDDNSAKIFIGDRTYINRRTELKCQGSITIGHDCAISWDVTIMDTDYHSINGADICKPIRIGNHVWIGCKSVILKGVTIGDGAIIAAGALVNSDVPPRTLVGGLPAKVLKVDVDWE